MEFPNPHGKLKPGMYGDVQIQVKGEQRLAVPRDAVLDSGLRTLVFVEQEPGLYQPREVTVGRQVGRFYPVRAGLTAGERVVTSATFLIDSESRLMAATNMMGMLGMGGIKMEQAQMGEMEMGNMPVGEATTSREQTVDGLTIALATDPEPPKKGENRLLLTVRSGGAPVTDAKVTLGYTMAMPGMEVETLEAKQTKDGVYEATVDFGMRGAWEVEVTVVRGQSKPLKATFTVSAGK
jgi:Cu(I)/Ag(I) efflux system membrane fusion protein